MRRNVNAHQISSVDFYDGYIFRFLQDIESSAGEIDGGLYRYYMARLERKLGGLLDHEGALASYLDSEFPANTNFIHVGIGLGTTTSLLAAIGRNMAGIESDQRRMATARQLRNSLCSMWPDAEKRYTLIEGYFPDVLDTENIPRGPETVVFFTNFVSSISDETIIRIVESFRCFGHAVVEMQMFGKSRDRPEERADLLNTIVSHGYSDQGDILSEVAGTHYRRFKTTSH